MARPKTSVDRLSNLREGFKSNVGKVLTAKQVEKFVGASYWRACVKDLKNEGMQIEAVRDGREVVGYKYTSTTGKAKAAPAKEVTKAPAKAARPSNDKAKKAAAEPVAASKPKAKTKPAAKAAKSVVEMVGETPAGEEDPDVLAILKQVGL